MKMYFQQAEHNPPHVHAQYGDYSAEFEIETGMLLEGRFYTRVCFLFNGGY
jgi:hypothetical protein